MYTRLLKIEPESPKSFFLFGPRGTGKTSWVKANFPDSIYIDLLDADFYMTLQSNPKRLNQYIPASFKGWIVLDEVQKIPQLLDEVHRLIENNRYRFILTCSSARKLRKQGVNLLAGRALRYAMYPFTAVELGDDFDLQQALLYGQLPSVISEPHPQLYLKSYVSTYLREEVLQEGLTRNLMTFLRFLEVASFSQGSLINMSEIARETGVTLRIVKTYFEILEDLLQSFLLPVFTKRAKRRMVSHPKFYYFDVGVYRTLRPLGPIDSPNEISGVAMESLFLQEIRAINDYLQYGYQFYYWRTSHGVEVDFIAYGPKGLLAFEIKSKAYIDNNDLKGLKTFKEDYPEAKLFLISGGSLREYHDDIQVIPIEIALKELLKFLDSNDDE
jgi:predicted AAA+ superfamily ATPase